MPDQLTILSHPAAIRATPNDSIDALMTTITERYAIPASSSLYLWRAEISNDLLDSHFTHMAESTLRNYAADASAGVAFLKGHDWRALPIGYSLAAAYGDEGGKKRVVADFYTVRGLSETDDLVLRMQAGILRDVSVGFHGGEMRCDLCSKDFWSCPHIPGLRYEMKDGDTMRSKLATFTIEDARLSEVSGVFDGSTPGAMILKAEQEASAGRLTPEQTRLLEHRLRVKLPATKRAFAGVDTPRGAIGAPVTDGQTPREDSSMTEEELMRLRSTLNVTSEEEVIGAAEKLAKRVADLEPQAADGRQYRTDLVTEALAEGVRAYGADFDKPTYEAMLTNAPIATIKRMAADFRKSGDERLPAGRVSVDSVEDKPQVETVQRAPDRAYAS